MPNENYDDDIILPDGFDPEKGWIDPPTDDDAAPAEGTTAPTTEPPEATPQMEEPPQTPEPTTAPVVPPMPQTIRVKFNHEERELGLDEAAMYAQKGMNYDKLEERVRGYEAQSAKSANLAKMLGYESADEMLAAAEKNYIERQVRELMDEGNTESMARFLVEQRMAKAATPAPQTQPQTQSQPSSGVQEGQPNGQPAPTDDIPPERKAELMEFVRAYPGVTKLPDEVISANRSGVRLLVAYERYKNKAALDELAILKQNQAAAAKAPVSGVTGKASTKDADPYKNDPFMKGFDSADW